ncbi:hypothetical protein [Microbacterium telephonicum]|uniref:Uncharacterized protein n=1 Tax=Microbacterium telephonicum TaxID=1714841 RepID=A0A498C3D1_9MICO|nr:hypothetical protein [Microbacterium telephonicum]RLK47660.1 hypothetical protein C7474_2256 [Microbacterium telephonicum]
MTASDARMQEAVHLTLAGVVWLLAQDPEVRAMAEANDLEHFTLGCRTPAFDQKVARALVTVRDAATNHENGSAE